jgi:hypothetical protein
MGLKEDIAKSRKIKEKSLNAYLTSLKRTYREVLKKDDYDSDLFNSGGFLKKKYFDDVMDFLNTLKLPTRKNYLAAILVALTANQNQTSSDKDIVNEYRNNLDSAAEEYNDKIKNKDKSDKLSNNWVSMEELLKIVKRYKRTINEKKLETKKEFSNADMTLYQMYLVGSLYTILPPVRNDYAEMNVISFKDYNNLKDKNNNYLVTVGKNKKFFNLGAYKTSDVYGVKIIQIPTLLNKIINKWLEHNTTGYFIINKQKKAISDNSLTKLLYKTFSATGKKIGSTLIRHIYLSERYGDINEQKEEDSFVMGHSLAMQTAYVKK